MPLSGGKLMRSPLILYPLILAVLGWTASGHAAPQMRDERFNGPTAGDAP